MEQGFGSDTLVTSLATSAKMSSSAVFIFILVK